MGCMRRALLVAVIVLFALTFGASLLVLGSAGLLGEAALMAADDVILLFILNLTSLVGLGVLTLMLWQNHRVRSGQERRIEELQAALQAKELESARPMPAPDPVVTSDPSVVRPRFCGACGEPVTSTGTYCTSCGQSLL